MNYFEVKEKEKEKDTKDNDKKTIFYIFDMLNKNNDFKSSNYQNKDFDQYLSSELKCPKEEKCLLINIFINICNMIKKIDKMNALKQFVIQLQIIIYNDIMRLFKKNYGKIIKLK